MVEAGLNLSAALETLESAIDCAQDASELRAVRDRINARTITQIDCRIHTLESFSVIVTKMNGETKCIEALLPDESLEFGIFQVEVWI